MPLAVSLCHARPWVTHKAALAIHGRDSMDKMDLFISSQGLFVHVFFRGVAVVYSDATKELGSVYIQYE